jgi:primosomal protein N' (replication factor Y)
MPRIIQVAVPRPLHAVYDYVVPDGLAMPAVGARVDVPFGRSFTVGICVRANVESIHERLKEIRATLDESPAVDEQFMQLAEWMADYYHHPLGEVLATMLPAAARRGAQFELDADDYWRVTQLEFDNRRARRQAALHDHLAATGIASGADVVAAGFSRDLLRKLFQEGYVERVSAPLGEPTEGRLTPTVEQADAIKAITSRLHEYRTFLLEGVTGSGKTEVYLQSMQPVIASGRQVLVLVPEIALTPQTLGRFARRFGSAGMLHSNLTDHERLQTWLKCRQGRLPILIGTRSAIFTPFRDLGLIIVDEEHDGSYKQQEGLRYSARDLAVKRAQMSSVPLVLGTATPSLETLHNAERGRYTTLALTHRAGGAEMPKFNVIDMRGQTVKDGFSNPMIAVLRRHLNQDGQVIVFLNRRGFAPTLLCPACGWQAQCSACDARLTLHRTPPQLVCHHCALKYLVPGHCDECGANQLLPVGLGTQRSAAGLAALFPNVPIHRIDRDTTRSSRQLEAQFDAINKGDSCIMVGTQMIAKGHHFPNVTLVAVVNADAGFLSPDFRAPERTAQLIVQVAGRAGRAQRPGEVWIQSYQPENPALVSLIHHGYRGFAAAELRSREQMDFPPIRPMAMLRAESGHADEALDFLEQCKRQLTGCEVLGPTPAPLGRIANRYRFQLMLIGANRTQLHATLSRLSVPPKLPRSLRWSIDVDPYDTL